MKMSFIGAGSMAEAIIAGLVEKEICPGKNIYVMNKNDSVKMALLERQYGIQPAYSLGDLMDGADIVILAVKPKDAESALTELKPYIAENTFIISVMAGISIGFLEEKIGLKCAIARSMPNTSASIGKSATAVTFNDFVTSKQKEMALTAFSAIGTTTIVEENKLDAITAVSGSGPAYIYYVVEAMEESARELGLDRETAKQLILQTLSGAADMLISTGKEASELRRAVTSPGGTTEAGIKVLESEKVKEAFGKCMKAAKEQSKKMGKMYESQPFV